MLRALARLVLLALVLALLPATASVAATPELDFDSDRLNDEILAGVRADDVSDDPIRSDDAPPSSDFATPIAAESSFAQTSCPLSFYPPDPDDSSFFIGVTPYQDVAPRLCAAATSPRIDVRVAGASVEGREIPVVDLTAPWSAEDAAANEALETLLVEDPEAARELFENGGYDDYRPHITINSNIHGNEYEGLDSTLDFIEYVAAADGSDPITENLDNLTAEEIAALPTVDEVLSSYVITIVPTSNPDGRVMGQRANSNGFDLNRDSVTGSQPETHIVRDVITGTTPLLFIDIHGYVGSAGLIEPCTPPHNFAYEYDLYLPNAYDAALSMESEAFRRTTILDGTGRTETYLPYRDDDQGWDDWPPIFIGMYAIYHGGSGHTVEVPLNPRGGSLPPEERARRVSVNTEFARASIDGTILEGMSSRDDLLADQIEWNVRGVTAADQQNENLLDGAFPHFDALDLWETDYPDAYVLPVGAGQESDAAAARLVDFLISQDVVVTQLSRPTSIGGTTYPTGSWVVPMAQTKRSIAQTLLDIGQDITPRGINAMYDISGWSLSDLWGATVERVANDPLLDIGEPVSDTPTRGRVVAGDAVAYAFPIRDASDVGVLNRLHDEGVTVQRAADGRVLVAPSARPLLLEIAQTTDITFTPLAALPADRTVLEPFVVGTNVSGPELYVMTDVLGLDVVPVGTATVNGTDPDVSLDDVDVLYLDGAPRSVTADGYVALAEWMEAGGGVVAYGTAVDTLAAAGLATPTRNTVSRSTNGTISVAQAADSEVMPGRPAQDVTFVYGPSFFSDLPADYEAVQTVLEGSAGGVMRTGHWAAVDSYPQAETIGRAVTVAGELADGERVVVTGADTLFRDMLKGLDKDLVDWLIWADGGAATTDDLGDPFVQPTAPTDPEPTDPEPTDPEPTDPEPTDPGAATVDRIAGESRVGTAIALSEASFPEGADTVVVATANDYPDALTAGPLAGLSDGPVLLSPGDTVPTEVLAEIQRLAPSEIIIAGGTAVMSEAAEAQLAELATVLRLAGDTRFGTAAAVSAHFAQPGGTVVIATGESFADALAGGVLAGRRDAPVLLVQGNGVPDVTAAEIQRLAPSDVIVMGGTAAVTDAVVAEVGDLAGVTPRRIAGADRYETAALTATELGSAEVAFIATAGTFADALAAVPVAVIQDGVLLLVDVDRVPETVSTVLADLTPPRITVLGGTSAVSEAVVDALG